jgi:hypothetical protein
MRTELAFNRNISAILTHEFKRIFQIPSIEGTVPLRTFNTALSFHDESHASKKYMHKPEAHVPCSQS